MKPKPRKRGKRRCKSCRKPKPGLLPGQTFCPECAEDRTPKPGELQLKEWVNNEIERTGYTYGGVYYRLMTGKYDNVKLRCVNKRVVFVKAKASDENR